MTSDELLQAITDRYLGSRDFNGFSTGTADASLVSELVREGLVAVTFGDYHPNPHIRAFEDEPVAEQLQKIADGRLGMACAYPTTRHLEKVVDRTNYIGRPYALALALGAPQLRHKAFDLHVLEPYRNDPRYSYDCDDIYGQLSGFANEDGLRDRDNAFLKFGFAYGDDMARYVAVFNWELFRLSPEHQQMWSARETDASTMLHPDYYRTQVLGDWPERISIYGAFIEELRVINRMAGAMGRKPLFRRDYENARPKAFASLLRPTLREFNDFVRLLDVMLSDNLSTDFFNGEVPLESEHERPDGRIEVRRRGSIQILESWIALKFRPRDPDPVKEMFATLRRIRAMRNKPSHSALEDEFSKEIAENQRNLMIDAYAAVRLLRLILANHAKAKTIEIDEQVREGLIWAH